MDGENLTLRRRNMLDVSGGFIGEPFVPLSRIEHAAGSETARLELVSGDPSGRAGRLVEHIRGETAELHHADALLTFLRDRRDIYLLVVRKEPPDPSDERVFRGRLTIMEPLALSRGRREIATAFIARVPSAAGVSVTYSVRIPVFDAEADRPLASYAGLVLLDKVLSRLVAVAPTERDVDIAWAG